MVENTPAHFFNIDDEFANYTILQFCGRGAYGEVYLAEDISHKTVALKIIPIASGSEVWKMELIGLRHYRQNVENHSALIEVLHVGETDDFFYYTMEAADNMLHGNPDEYVADTLAHRLERGGRLEPEKVLELANTLLDGIEHLAEHDLAHRDIKPGNIVFVNGQAKLSDIGLISTTGVRSKIVGTLDFLPPELADGDPVGYGHDLYALGKVLYCALTGLLPEHFPEVPLTVPLRAWRQFKNVLLKACSPDPRQRFYTPDAFRAALPSEIKATTRIDEGFELLRAFRKANPVIWRLSLAATFLIMGALLLFVILEYEHRKNLANMEQNRINFIFRTIDMLNDCQLHLQRVSAGSGNTVRPWQLQEIAMLASTARAAENWDATERYCIFADAILRRWSEEEFQFLLQQNPISPLPEKTVDLLHLLANYSNFQATPLFAYLSDNAKQTFVNRIDALKNKLANQWAGPMPVPGSDWMIPGDENLRFTYIARGRLPGEPQRSYWLGINEVTRETVCRLIPENGLNMQPNQLPATGLSWNDRLDICRKLTEQARQNGTLPGGYIYRLPYADEWLFAMHGAWESAGNFLHEQQNVNDFAWYSGNSNYQLHPVRTRQAGTLGIYDMIGNASESVLLKETQPGQTPAAGNFGASFRDRRISSNLDTPAETDQMENNWTGLRLVLAPGSIDYFDLNWQQGFVHELQIDGNNYEVLGGSRSRWTGQTAQAWCELLQCDLAIIKDRSLRQKLFSASSRIGETPTLVGGIFNQGQWYWQDRTPLNGGEWLGNKPQQDSADAPFYLVWDHGFYRSLAATEHVQQIVVKKPAAMSVPDLEKITSPLVLKKFEFNNRKFYLLQAPVDWYTARRLANLLGGELAKVTDADEKILQNELQSFADQRIALGGYRKHGKWVYLDGSDGPEKLPADAINRHESLNNCFMAFYVGRLCNAADFDAFLCEVKK